MLVSQALPGSAPETFTVEARKINRGASLPCLPGFLTECRALITSKPKQEPAAKTRAAPKPRAAPTSQALRAAEAAQTSQALPAAEAAPTSQALPTGEASTADALALEFAVASAAPAGSSNNRRVRAKAAPPFNQALPAAAVPSAAVPAAAVPIGEALPAGAANRLPISQAPPAASSARSRSPRGERSEEVVSGLPWRPPVAFGCGRCRQNAKGCSTCRKPSYRAGR